jgi:hypothetical protein
MTSNNWFTTRMVGPNYSPKYVVRDKRRDTDMFWTGHKWSRNPRRAMLFFDMGKVWEVIQALTVAFFRERFRPQRFHITVDVTVYGDVSREEVEAYLSRAMKLRVNYDEHGTGPGDDSLVLIDIPDQGLVPAR